MKKLLMAALTAITLLALPSFSNTNKPEVAPSVKVIQVSSENVGITMDTLSTKGKYFISSSCIKVKDLKTILDTAKALGNGLIRLSIVQDFTGSNKIVINYYDPTDNSSLEIPYLEVRDAKAPSDTSQYQCKPSPCPPTPNFLYANKSVAVPEGKPLNQ